MSRKQAPDGGPEFSRQFDGPEVLTELFASSGIQTSLEEVVRQIQEAIASGQSPSELFPSLFQGEPRFPSPAVARRLFQNLFGLWDLVQKGKPWQAAPLSFGEEGPSGEFVEAAQRHLEGLKPKERNRLLDAFENRQDALLTWLDESGLSDDGYLVARDVLFASYAILTLGWATGLRNLTLGELNSGAFEPQVRLPEALKAFAETALSKRGGAVNKTREAVLRGLLALWNARRKPR